MKRKLHQGIFQMNPKNALKRFGITHEQYQYILNSTEIRRILSDNNIHEVEIPDEINSQHRPSASNTSIATTPIAQPVMPQYQQQGSPIPRSTNQQMPQFTSPQSPLVALAHDYLAMSERKSLTYWFISPLAMSCFTVSKVRPLALAKAGMNVLSHVNSHVSCCTSAAPRPQVR